MTDSNQSQNLLDITAFDAVTECEDGHEFELKDKDGITGTGVKLVILGKHADVVNKWLNKTVNAMIRERQIAERKGRGVDAKSLDEIREHNIDGAVIRVIGWKNVKQPFTPELLKASLKRNPHWVDQIVEESDNLGNFSKAQ